MTKYFAATAILCGAPIAVPLASAANISWTDWASVTGGNPGSASGTITLSPGISVAYAGQTTGIGNDYPSWTPSDTFSGGTVSNAPPANFNSILLTGGNAAPNTIAFSAPVSDPVMAIWSLGARGSQASFNFTDAEPFSLLAGGSSAEYGGSSITASGSDVLGAEGNGVIQFSGTFSQLTWTTPSYENYYAFTVGVAGAASPSTVPEPAAMGLSAMGLGLLLLAVFRRRVAKSP